MKSISVTLERFHFDLFKRVTIIIFITTITILTVIIIIILPFPEGLLRSPQTGPPHPPAPLAEDHHQGLTRASLNTFDDATAESFEEQHNPRHHFGSSSNDPHHHCGSSSKSSFEDSSLPSLAPSRSHTSNCAKVINTIIIMMVIIMINIIIIIIVVLISIILITVIPRSKSLPVPHIQG